MARTILYCLQQITITVWIFYAAFTNFPFLLYMGITFILLDKI